MSGAGASSDERAGGAHDGASTSASDLAGPTGGAKPAHCTAAASDGAPSLHIATELAKLSAEMLVTAPSKRPSAAEVLARLQALATATGTASMAVATEGVDVGRSTSPTSDVDEESESAPRDINDRVHVSCTTQSMRGVL